MPPDPEEEPLVPEGWTLKRSDVDSALRRARAATLHLRAASVRPWIVVAVFAASWLAFGIAARAHGQWQLQMDPGWTQAGRVAWFALDAHALLMVVKIRNAATIAVVCGFVVLALFRQWNVMWSSTIAATLTYIAALSLRQFVDTNQVVAYLGAVAILWGFLAAKIDDLSARCALLVLVGLLLCLVALPPMFVNLTFAVEALSGLSLAIASAALALQIKKKLYTKPMWRAEDYL